MSSQINARKAIYPLMLSKGAWIIGSALLISFTIWSRLKYASKYLFSWDSVQFALSLQKFDVRLHQPHPPGYPLYCLILRLFHFVIHDVNLTFIAINIVFTIGTCFCLGAVAWILTESEEYSKRFWISFGAASIYVLNPLVWFHGCVAEIYVVEGFWVSAIAFTVLMSDRTPVFTFISAAVLATAGGFRPSTEFFLLPFYLYSLVGKDRKTITQSLTILCLVTLCWFIPLALLSGGFARYFAVLMRQISQTAGHTNIFVQSLQTVEKAAPIISFRLAQAITIPILVAIFLKFPRIRLSRREKDLALMPLLPLLFFLFIHYAKDGYLLVIVPVVIVLSVCLVGRLYGRFFLIIIFGLACLEDYRSFVHAPFFAKAEIDQNVFKKAVYQITLPNTHLIGAFNARFDDFMKAAHAFPEKIFVVCGDYFPDWRQIMYYFPQDQAVLLLPQDVRASVASDLKSKLMKPPIRLDANENSVIVFVMPEAPNLPDLKRFKVYEYEYYFAQSASLPEKFNVCGIDFVKVHQGSQSQN